jgi:hypothetical protein
MHDIFRGFEFLPNLEGRFAEKLQTPTSKLQKNSKLQTPKEKGSSLAVFQGGAKLPLKHAVGSLTGSAEPRPSGISDALERIPSVWNLKLGVFLDVGCWSLEFGVS